MTRLLETVYSAIVLDLIIACIATIFYPLQQGVRVTMFSLAGYSFLAALAPFALFIKLLRFLYKDATYEQCLCLLGNNVGEGPHGSKVSQDTEHPLDRNFQASPNSKKGEEKESERGNCSDSSTRHRMSPVSIDPVFKQEMDAKIGVAIDSQSNACSQKNEKSKERQTSKKLKFNTTTVTVLHVNIADDDDSSDSDIGDDMYYTLGYELPMTMKLELQQSDRIEQRKHASRHA